MASYFGEKPIPNEKFRDLASAANVGAYRYGIACGRSHNAIFALANHGSYWTAAWFVLRGLYQAVKGHGGRFRQCVINAGIQVGSRRKYRRKELQELS
jgi:hypothetical protein